ncbi:hypothetical protein GCM10010416_44670 [Streptomyces caniferus]
MAGAVALPSVRAPIRSVVSLTKGPSLERASACLARRPVVLSGWVLGLVDRAGAVVPPEVAERISSWLRREEMQTGHVVTPIPERAHVCSGHGSKQFGRLPEESGPYGGHEAPRRSGVEY